MSDISHGPLLYEGKAKRLYETDNPAELLVEFKDSLTAFDNVKKGQMAGKVAVNNQVSAIIMGLLNEAGIEMPMPVQTLHHRVEDADRDGLVAVLREGRQEG